MQSKEWSNSERKNLPKPGLKILKPSKYFNNREIFPTSSNKGLGFKPPHSGTQMGVNLKEEWTKKFFV